MKTLDVSVKPDAKASAVSFKLNLGENTAELVKQFSEEVIFNMAKSAIVVAVQGYARNKMNAKENPVKAGVALQNAINAWKPGIRASGTSALEKLKERLAKLTPEQRAALLGEGGGKKK